MLRSHQNPTASLSTTLALAEGYKFLNTTSVQGAASYTRFHVKSWHCIV